MAYVITQNCCKDASCVPVCPVDCIRPAGTSDGFDRAEMLYIDPTACIDCGACLEECPVDAIYHEDDLPPELERFRDINARYFQCHTPEPVGSGETPVDHPAVTPGSLRVAIVGTGPAASYAAQALVAVEGVEVDMFERLPTPYGLIRAGVAPDHQRTKSVVRVFERVLRHKRVHCHFNVDIGRDLSHSELMAHHHAVVYAVGAPQSRTLGIPGEGLPGNHSVVDFVGWYNGHPDHADKDFDLSGERVVIVGNGNVALDVARVLVMKPEELEKTDIADHALEALRHSSVREVVIVARRGPRDAAYTAGEFLALGNLADVDVVVDHPDLDPAPGDDHETALKLEIARDYASRPRTAGNKRIVFRFMTSPTEIIGSDHVTGLRVVANTVDETGALVVGRPDGETEIIETSLVLQSIGYRGSAVEGVPFDNDKGAVPNERGRVTDLDGEIVPGVYVAGWIKRGPRGVIGTNRVCAGETVHRLLEDFREGRLSRDVKGREALRELLAARDVARLDWSGWEAIDTAERERGAAAVRPRVKLVDVSEMLTAAGV